MPDKSSASEEVVMKEYPRSSRWLEGQQVIGVGNLVLTGKRLVFLNQVPLEKKEIEYFRKLSEGASTSRVIDLALTLHKNNFQIPLSSLIQVKTGLYSIFPFPRPCLRISYRSEKKKKQIKAASFMFTIPLLKGFFQLEITTVLGWVWMIKKAMRASNEQGSNNQRPASGQTHLSQAA